jgi:hypothetical protein
MMNKVRETLAFLKQIITIQPGVLKTYRKIILHPINVYSDVNLKWDKKYFTASLALMAFIFAYAIPVLDYTESGFLQCIIQTAVDKTVGILSKGSILYLSVLYMIFSFLLVVPFFIFSKFRKIKTCINIILYAFGTIYLTVSFILIFEHVAMMPFQQHSILLQWKDNLSDSIILEPESSQTISQRVDQPDRTEKISFFQKGIAYSKFGTDIAARYLSHLARHQYFLIMTLYLCALIYPLFCVIFFHLIPTRSRLS